MKLIHLPAIVLLVFCTSRLPAQEIAEEIERLLSKNVVTYAAAARFLLEASDTLVTPDVHEAFLYASQRKWLPKNAAENEAARFDGVSLLIMRSFNLKGGIMYTIFKTPHYSYRELVSKSIIQGRADPAMYISGEKLLFITSKALIQKETEKMNEK
jgi:hypothetical protein